MKLMLYKTIPQVEQIFPFPTDKTTFQSKNANRDLLKKQTKEKSFCLFLLFCKKVSNLNISSTRMKYLPRKVWHSQTSLPSFIFSSENWKTKAFLLFLLSMDNPWSLSSLLFMSALLTQSLHPICSFGERNGAWGSPDPSLLNSITAAISYTFYLSQPMKQLNRTDFWFTLVTQTNTTRLRSSTELAIE